jgi:hypothetical protein
MDGAKSNQDELALAERWDRLMGVKDQFAGELESVAVELPGEPSRRLRECSRWLRRGADLESTLQRRHDLGICLPLMKLSRDEAMTDAALAEAARIGACVIGRDSTTRPQFIRKLAYPLGMLFGVSLLAMLFSFFVSPMFEEMFDEFGIELPAMTNLVLASAQVVRRLWWIVAIVIVVAAIANWGWKLTSNGSRSSATNWVDYRMISNRDSLASWAWHVSLLLQLGVSQCEAVKNAGLDASKNWLRRSSLELHRCCQKRPDAELPPLLPGSRYRMLGKAMQVPDSDGKIGMLQEVADYYWDRNRSVGDWWISSLSVCLLCVVGVCLFLAIISLFMPLIAIVSGLTSSK